MLLVITAVLLLVAGISGQLPQSPCPHIFQYVEGNDNPWDGMLRIKAPGPGVTINLRLELYLRTILPSKYAGRLGLADDKSVVTQILLSGGRERIRYRVEFPVPYPVPEINRIILNQAVICEGPIVTANGLTKIALEHTLYPVVSPLQNPSSSFIPEPVKPLQWQLPGFNLQNPFLPRPQTEQVFTEKPFLSIPGFFTPNKPQKPDVTIVEYEQPWVQPKPKPTEQPWVQPKPKPTEQPWVQPKPKPIEQPSKPLDSSIEDICGLSVTPNQLVLNGKPTARGEWPWLVAMFVITDLGQEFRCSGTLINRKFVLTAAHCVKISRSAPALKPDNLVVYLGKYNLKRFGEPDTQTREIEQVILHPDYGLGSNYDADLAVLQLSLPAVYSRYVVPICMWNQGPDLSPVVGHHGMVVGWGRDEKGNKITDEPRLAQVPIVAQDVCLYSQKEYAVLTSNRTFCGGFRNETGPCNGDSGSGLVLPRRDGSRQRWFLRGIVSISLYNKEENRCDLKNYIVFTDVAKHIEWLSQFRDDNSFL